MSRQLEKLDTPHYLDSMCEERKLDYVVTTEKKEIQHYLDSSSEGGKLDYLAMPGEKKKALNIIWTHHEKEEPQPSNPRPLFVRHYTLQRARPLDGLLCPPPSGPTLSETCILSYSLYPRSVGASPSALIRIAGTCMANLLSMIYNWIVK